MRGLFQPFLREWKLIAGAAIFVGIAVYGYNLKIGGILEARERHSYLAQGTVTSVRVNPHPIDTMHPSADVRLILDGRVVNLRTKATWIGECKADRLIHVRILKNKEGRTFYKLGPKRCF